MKKQIKQIVHFSPLVVDISPCIKKHKFFDARRLATRAETTNKEKTTTTTGITILLEWNIDNK